MADTSANPIIVGLLFIGRCLVPVVLMLGLSYLLRRWGLIQSPTRERNGEDENNNGGEGLAHGNP